MDQVQEVQDNMWRIHWDMTTWHTFDTQQDLIDWVQSTAGQDWHSHQFSIQENIDGQWTTPSAKTKFSI